MEIKEIENKNIWENFINRYCPEALFQSWLWGEVVKRNQHLWRWGIFDKKELIGIAQVNKVKAKRGTFLHIRHGPIFSSLNVSNYEFFLSFLKNIAKKEKASFLRISPLLLDNEENRNFFKKIGFRNSPIHAMDGEYCWVLDINKSENELLAGMRKTTRYLIKKAEKLGVEIIKSKKFKDLDDFFSLYAETARRHKFVQHVSIREEFEELSKEDKIIIFKGCYQKKLLAVALIIFYNNQAIYHHSASIEQKIPVNYLLQWEAIKEAKRLGKNLYNFWGVAPEGKKRHPWLGHSLFKRGFGGRIISYLHAQDYPLSIRYCTTYVIELLRKWRKGY
uniref:Peptidoglycan bridge formation glycyltransferase FemA/FemB family protein n=1 Tax=candidate division CPR3 bacterium TaxID=2268181 RepID=A0A7C4M2K6_UNCC3